MSMRSCQKSQGSNTTEEGQRVKEDVDRQPKDKRVKQKDKLYQRSQNTISSSLVREHAKGKFHPITCNENKEGE
jgi:hypothetical protein